jgi:Histidine kinase-like ATPase domain
VPHPGNGGRFEGWDRYEAAVNTVWQDFPVWGRCLYDTTTAPAAVLDVVERTHPRIVSPSGQRRESGRYQDALLFEGLQYAPDPLEGSPPAAELVNRPAADARHILAQIADGRVPATIVQDLLIGVTEAVTNAQHHGRPPVAVRIWAAPDRVVVTVHDTGPGPADRLAGLVRVPSSTPGQDLGMGLWVTSSTSTSRSATPAMASPSGSGTCPARPGRPPPRDHRTGHPARSELDHLRATRGGSWTCRGRKRTPQSAFADTAAAAARLCQSHSPSRDSWLATAARPAKRTSWTCASTPAGATTICAPSRLAAPTSHMTATRRLRAARPTSAGSKPAFPAAGYDEYSQARVQQVPGVDIAAPVPSRPWVRPGVKARQGRNPASVLQKLNGRGLCLSDHIRRACVIRGAGGSTPEI